MAIRLIDRYPTRANPANTDYPHGSGRNKTGPTAVDGTPFDEARFNDQEGFFQSLLEAAEVTPNNTPDTVPASQYADALSVVANGLIVIDVGGSADATLDYNQARVHGFRLTGALAGDISVIVPDTERMYTVVNDATGDFDVTVKTALGTGIVVPQGQTFVVRCDGADVVRGYDSQRTIYVGSVAGLIAIPAPIDGAQYDVTGYHPGSAVMANPDGGGLFVWSESRDKGDHNGGTVIDPDSTFPVDWNDQTQRQAWFDGSGLSGTGCWVRLNGKEVSIAVFGAIGDWDGTTGTDNTLSIQNAVEASCPFPWMGTVSATKAEMGKVQFEVVIPAGLFRITEGIYLTPFCRISGISRGAFFGFKSATLVADFDDQQGSILDAAPWDSTGTKVRDKLSGRSDFDGGSHTACVGWSVKDFGITVAAGRTVRTGINRTMSMQSDVDGMGIAYGAGRLFVGIRTNVTWGGAIRDCQIQAGMYALENRDDVTVDVQENNYLTVRKATKGPTETEFANFVQRTWPNTSGTQGINYNSACIYNAYASVHLYSNTCEAAEIGIKTSNATKMSDEGGFYEGITEYIYAVHSASGYARPNWIIADCPLVYVNGSKDTHIDVNLSSCSYFSVTGVGAISPFTPNGLKVSGGFVSDTFDSRVIYKDLQDRADVTIYVSTTGDDLNHGYSSLAPVLTLQGAMERTLPGRNNTIVFPDNATINTKNRYSDNTQSGEKTFSDRNVLLKGGAGSVLTFGADSSQAHALSMENGSLVINGLTVNLVGSNNNDYRACLRSNGVLNVVIKDCAISGAGTTSALFGAAYNKGGSFYIYLQESTLSDMYFVTSATAFSDSNAMWLENHDNCTFTNVITDESMKVKSKQFPTV